MLFRLVRPMKRSGSRNRYYVKRIPSDVRRKVTGVTLAIPVGDATQALTISPRTQAIRVSLRTDEPSEVKARQAGVDAYLENVWRAYRRDEPVALTHRQATAMAGEFYRGWAGGEGRETTVAMEHVPGVGWQRVQGDHLEPEEWEAVLESFGKAQADPLKLEKPLGAVVDRQLLTKGIQRVTPETRDVILNAFGQAAKDAFESRKRNAEGDYSPDPKAGRFPEWTAPQSAAKASPKVSLKGLVQLWWQEAQATGRKPSTYESYSRTITAFADFLEHDDASRITKSDVAAFKDYRLASTNPRSGRRIAPWTVKATDLAALKSVFGWAVTNGKLPSNPADGVTIKLGKRRTVRRGFKDAEALAILTAARKLKRGGERPETFAAKQWVPWLLAYTGARVGEMAQLRNEDVTQEGRHWVIDILPEAGTIKTDEARRVVVHPHLIEMGFVKFGKAAPAGYLFIRPAKDGDVLGPLQGVKNRLAEFARSLVSDKTVDPNHGWRHRFKSVCRAVGIDPEVRDYLQGHAPRTEGERYGEMPLRAQAKAIAKLPRYRVRD
jgi:integrase